MNDDQNSSATLVMPDIAPNCRRRRFSKRLFAAFILELALAVTVALMASRITRTPKPALESERRNFTRLVWMSGKGTLLNSFVLQGRYIEPRFSPEGTSLLLTRMKPGGAAIWRLALPNHELQRLTSDAVRSSCPVWSASGKDFVFVSWRRNRTEIFEAQKTGHPSHEFFRDESIKFPNDLSPDGRWLAFTRKAWWTSELWLLQPGTGKAFRFFDSKAEPADARFSPDGKWIAFTLNVAGQEDVYLAPFLSGTVSLPLRMSQLVRVSPEGGYSPEWGRDSTALFYMNKDRDLIKVELTDDSGLPKTTRKLFHIASSGSSEFEYRFGGYCVDLRHDSFIFALAGFVVPDRAGIPFLRPAD